MVRIYIPDRFPHFFLSVEQYAVCWGRLVRPWCHCSPSGAHSSFLMICSILRLFTVACALYLLVRATRVLFRGSNWNLPLLPKRYALHCLQIIILVNQHFIKISKYQKCHLSDACAAIAQVTTFVSWVSPVAASLATPCTHLHIHTHRQTNA